MPYPKDFLGIQNFDILENDQQLVMSPHPIDILEVRTDPANNA
jgi:hypothetical protein